MSLTLSVPARTKKKLSLTRLFRSSPSSPFSGLMTGAVLGGSSVDQAGKLQMILMFSTSSFSPLLSSTSSSFSTDFTPCLLLLHSDIRLLSSLSPLGHALHTRDGGEYFPSVPLRLLSPFFEREIDASFLRSPSPSFSATLPTEFDLIESTERRLSSREESSR